MCENQKIIFLYESPFVEAFVNKYCLWELALLGKPVLILDLSEVVDPEYGRKTSAKVSLDDRFEFAVMQDYSQTEELIRKYAKEAVFFPMFDNIYRTRRIFYLFTRYAVKYVFVNSLLSPLFSSPGSMKRFSLDRERLSFFHLRAAFYHRVLRKIIPHKQAASIFFCGEQAEDFCFSEGACGRKTKREYLYSFDYENLIQTQAYDNGGRKYCVFIDQFLPFHPDNIVYKKIFIDPDRYYSELEEMLRNMQQMLNLDILIAAHPQSNYEDKKYLKGFKVIYGQTAALVKAAEVICTHFSTAGIYAVMLKKPLLLFNPEVLHPVRLFQNAINELADATGARIAENADFLSNDEAIGFEQKKYDKCMADNISRVPPDGRYLWERIIGLI